MAAPLSFRPEDFDPLFAKVFIPDKIPLSVTERTALIANLRFLMSYNQVDSQKIEGLNNMLKNGVILKGKNYWQLVSFKTNIDNFNKIMNPKIDATPINQELQRRKEAQESELKREEEIERKHILPARIGPELFTRPYDFSKDYVLAWIVNVSGEKWQEKDFIKDGTQCRYIVESTKLTGKLLGVGVTDRPTNVVGGNKKVETDWGTKIRYIEAVLKRDPYALSPEEKDIFSSNCLDINRRMIQSILHHELKSSTQVENITNLLCQDKEVSIDLREKLGSPKSASERQKAIHDFLLVQNPGWERVLKIIQGTQSTNKKRELALFDRLEIEKIAVLPLKSG